MNDMNKISKELGDVNLSKMSDKQISELDEALFGKHELPIKKPKKVKKPTRKRFVDFTRNRVRLMFPDHKEYLKNIIDHMNKYDVVVDTMKTGLVVKVANEDGYKVNLLNFLEVRLVGGKLFGNLYLNRVKTEAHEEGLEDVFSNRRVKGTFTVEKISEAEFIKITGKKNMAYLIELCHEALMLKKRRNRKNRLK